MSDLETSDLYSKKFDTRDELVDAVKEFYRMKGYALKIKDSRKNRYVTIVCDRGIRSTQMTPQSKRLKESSNNVCPFCVYGKMQPEAGYWTIVMKNGLHNHEASLDGFDVPSTSGQPSSCGLTDEEIDKFNFPPVIIDGQVFIGDNRPEDVRWLCSLSESETDLLISLKKLALQRAKVVGHENLADIVDLRMLRALGYIVMQHVNCSLNDLQMKRLDGHKGMLDGCNLLKLDVKDNNNQHSEKVLLSTQQKMDKGSDSSEYGHSDKEIVPTQGQMDKESEYVKDSNEHSQKEIVPTQEEMDKGSKYVHQHSEKEMVPTQGEMDIERSNQHSATEAGMEIESEYVKGSHEQSEKEDFITTQEEMDKDDEITPDAKRHKIDR